ncbi:hypothetical protein LDENG_00289370, partial [Lucifuga dentata]
GGPPSPHTLREQVFYLCFISNICPTVWNNLKDHTTHFACLSPNIFNFHTCNVTDNHFPKHTTGTVN